MLRVHWMCKGLVALGVSVFHLDSPVAAAEIPQNRELKTVIEVDDLGHDRILVSKTSSDTLWIADWTFDDGSQCNDSGWEKIDNRIRSNASVHWKVDDAFSGTGAITGQAAVLSKHDLCWLIPDGYGNNWYQAIRIEYCGKTLLSANYLLDSEAGFDFMQVEVDSQCVTLEQQGVGLPLYSESGLNSIGTLAPLALTDFAAPNDTHCVYISFFSDAAFSQEDGLQSTTLDAALVVDHVVLADGGDPTSPAKIIFSEDFEGELSPHLSFVAVAGPLGETPGLWARLFPNVGDTDVCTENTTCSWVFFDPDYMCQASELAPRCVRPGIDNSIVSPWVSLASTPDADGTVLSFREFQGNFWTAHRIVRSWSVRGKIRIENTDSPTPGDSIDCATPWRHTFEWATLSDFTWLTQVENIEGHFDPASLQIQVRFRVADWQWIVPEPPLNGGLTGPGPFIDRVRIGRRNLSGPVISEGIDSRSQAQDAFPTEVNPAVPPGLGEHHQPTTDRFGTAAFSPGDNLGALTPFLINGDSISVEVRDVRDAGGIVSVEWYGIIVSGPHAGLAPPPWSVGTNGFFMVPADSARDGTGAVIADHWFVDLDEDYFRGGDALRYFWIAADALGGVTSDPEGLSAVPASEEVALAATGGLLEVNFLPKIDWSPTYLSRIAASPDGKLEPTPAELAGSEQANCILYAQLVNPRRLGGKNTTCGSSTCEPHRTSFMHTLGTLGYGGHFDVYDVQGYGNTNNQLAGRATIEQATGYALIIYDAGNASPGAPILPDGLDVSSELVDQAGWFRDWLAQASTPSLAGIATLWMLGSNALQEKPAHPLYTADMGAILATANQGLSSNPDVEGRMPMLFSNGNTADFAADLFSVNGGCPSIRNYDGLGSAGTGVETHAWKDPSSGLFGDSAIVMNSSPVESWNTILQAHAWSDIRDPSSGPSAPSAEAVFMSRVLGAVLPQDCRVDPPTGIEGIDNDIAAPKRTWLFQNVPNPFNPSTTIRFDLARRGRIELRVFDITGRIVRTLVDEELQPRAYEAVWDGRDRAGRRLPSGVYFYRLVAPEFEASHKVVLMK